jgi:hypothetical protein
MTEYERLSLMLLVHIASGIAHLATQANMSTPETRLRHAESVLEWQKQVQAMLETVTDAIRQDNREQPA